MTGYWTVSHRPPLLHLSSISKMFALFILKIFFPHRAPVFLASATLHARSVEIDSSVVCSLVGPLGLTPVKPISLSVKTWPSICFSCGHVKLAEDHLSKSEQLLRISKVFPFLALKWHKEVDKCFCKIDTMIEPHRAQDRQSSSNCNKRKKKSWNTFRGTKRKHKTYESEFYGLLENCCCLLPWTHTEFTSVLQPSKSCFP